jgi:hypothetical protein
MYLSRIAERLKRVLNFWLDRTSSFEVKSRSRIQYLTQGNSTGQRVLGIFCSSPAHPVFTMYGESENLYFFVSVRTCRVKHKI